MKSLRQKMVAMAAVVAVSGLMMASVAGAADKLIVKDATGTLDVFKVDDAGTAMPTKLSVGAGATTLSTIHNAESSTSAARGITASQHNAGAQGAAINFVKSRGTYAVPVMLTSGDYIGAFVAQFWNGTAYARGAQFGFRSEGTVTGTSTPTHIFFQTGDTTVNLKEALRVTSAQNVVVGNLGGAATADMATTATNGFLYIPNVAGSLTTCGTMTAIAGHTPIWFDTTNKKVCSCDAGTLKCTAALN